MNLNHGFYPRWYVRTTKFFFVVVLLVVVLADTLIRILHFRPISPCFQHIGIAPLHAALPGSLARQYCPAELKVF
jgi:hypothetical protein